MRLSRLSLAAAAGQFELHPAALAVAARREVGQPQAVEFGPGDRALDEAIGDRPCARISVSVISMLVLWRSAVRKPKIPKTIAKPPSTVAGTGATGIVAKIAPVGTSPAAARR